MGFYYGNPNNRDREVIPGSDADDMFYPLGGWDVVQGKGGVDTVYVEGLRANFRVLTEEGVTYIDALTGASAGVERAQLFEVERIEFIDGTIDLTLPQGFVGRDGNDVFVGNAGFDTATYAGPRSQFKIERVGDFHLVTDTRGAGGVDRVQNVERLVFADGKVALDWDGPARDAARLVGTLLGPQSVQGSAQAEQVVGAVLKLLDQGQSLAQVASSAMSILEWDTPTLLAQIYLNALGRAASAEELASLGQQLQGIPTSDVAVMACDLGLIDARIGLVGLASTGLNYL